MKAIETRMIPWSRGHRRPWLDKIAARMGYVPAWMVPKPAPKRKIVPDPRPPEQVRETLDDWWSKAKRVELMSVDTEGPDNRHLMVLLRFTAPKSHP